MEQTRSFSEHSVHANMPMTRDLNEIARAHLAQLGVPDAVARHVQLQCGPDDRATIAVGYQTATRFAETAMANLPSLEDAIATLASKERIAALIGAGIRAMPASLRPDVPDWMSDAGKRLNQDLRRARELANRAAISQRFEERTIGPGRSDAPF